jgi:hypothetical protein
VHRLDTVPWFHRVRARGFELGAGATRGVEELGAGFDFGDEQAIEAHAEYTAGVAFVFVCYLMRCEIETFGRGSAPNTNLNWA